MMLGDMLLTQPCAPFLRPEHSLIGQCVLEQNRMDPVLVLSSLTHEGKPVASKLFPLSYMEWRLICFRKHITSQKICQNFGVDLVCLNASVGYGLHLHRMSKMGVKPFTLERVA